MKPGIVKRLEDLEAQYKEDPLIVLARLDTGEEVKMPMRELVTRSDADFVRVVSGGSIKDADMYLSTFTNVIK